MPAVDVKLIFVKFLVWMVAKILQRKKISFYCTAIGVEKYLGVVFREVTKEVPFWGLLCNLAYFSYCPYCAGMLLMCC